MLGVLACGWAPRWVTQALRSSMAMKRTLGRSAAVAWPIETANTPIAAARKRTNMRRTLHRAKFGGRVQPAPHYSPVFNATQGMFVRRILGRRLDEGSPFARRA